jgi:hypothetical protein
MRDRMASAQRPPLLMILALSFEIEDVKSDLIRLTREIRCPLKPCMHGKRMIGYVIVTHETVDELRERIKHTLEELSGIYDYTIFPAPHPDHVVGRAGRVSPLAHWLRLGWLETRQLGKPDDVRELKGRQS